MLRLEREYGLEREKQKIVENTPDPVEQAEALETLVETYDQDVDRQGQLQEIIDMEAEVAALRDLYPDFALTGMETVGDLSHRFTVYVREAIAARVSEDQTFDVTKLPEYLAIANSRYKAGMEAKFVGTKLLINNIRQRFNKRLFSEESNDYKEYNFGSLTLIQAKPYLFKAIENITVHEINEVIKELGGLKGKLSEPRDIQMAEKVTALTVAEIKRNAEAFKAECFAKADELFFLPLQKELFAREIKVRYLAETRAKKEALEKQALEAKKQALSVFDAFVDTMPRETHSELRQLFTNHPSPALVAAMTSHVDAKVVISYLFVCDALEKDLNVITTENAIALANRPETLKSMVALCKVVRFKPNNLQLKTNQQEYFNQLIKLNPEQMLNHTRFLNAVCCALEFINQYKPSPATYPSREQSDDEKRHNLIKRLFDVFTSQSNIGLWALSIPDPANAAKLLKLDRNQPKQVCFIIQALISDPECLKALITLITESNQPLAETVQFVDTNFDLDNASCRAFQTKDYTAFRNMFISEVEKYRANNLGLRQ